MSMVILPCSCRRGLNVMHLFAKPLSTNDSVPARERTHGSFCRARAVQDEHCTKPDSSEMTSSPLHAADGTSFPVLRCVQQLRIGHAQLFSGEAPAKPPARGFSPSHPRGFTCIRHSIVKLGPSSLGD